MSNNVFWGIVSGILVVWLVCMAFFVGGKFGEYGDASAKLRGTVKGLSRYATKKDEELPTAKLLEEMTKHYESWESNVKEAREFYAKRDQQFEAYSDPSSAAWNARVKVEFDRLVASYGEKLGIEPDKLTVPFVRPTPSESQLVAAQREWNVTRAIVERGMDANVRLSSYTKVNKRSSDRREGDFDLTRVAIEGTINAPKLEGFISSLLGDKVINFEIESCQVVKDPKSLQYEVVHQHKTDDPSDDGAIDREPQVRFRMTVAALDWDPQEKKDEKGKEG